MSTRKILDPICDMVVDLDEAHQEGLTLEHAGHEYGFCSAGCRQKFERDPDAFIPKVQTWLANGAHAHATGVTAAVSVIDDGIRAWYSSCRCCLSDAHPEIVEVLDRERDAAAQPKADAGICEIAESSG